MLCVRVAGKTVVLVMEGLKTLRQGCDVIVLGWRKGAWAASHLVAEQLRVALGANPPSPPRTAGRVVTLNVDLGWSAEESKDDREERQAREAARVLADAQAAAARPGHSPLVIVDEADFSFRYIYLF